jgi:hypothetical protein
VCHDAVPPGARSGRRPLALCAGSPPCCAAQPRRGGHGTLCTLRSCCTADPRAQRRRIPASLPSQTRRGPPRGGSVRGIAPSLLDPPTTAPYRGVTVTRECNLRGETDLSVHSVYRRAATVESFTALHPRPNRLSFPLVLVTGIFDSEFPHFYPIFTRSEARGSKHGKASATPLVVVQRIF